MSDQTEDQINNSNNNKDDDFVKLMLDNDMDVRLREVENSEKAAQQIHNREPKKSKHSQKSDEQRISGPSIDQLEPVGKDFYKKVIAVVVITSIGILTLGFLF